MHASRVRVFRLFNSPANEGCLSWKSDALDKPGKPLICAQGVEGWFDVEQSHLPVPRLDRLVEPLERAIGFSKGDVHQSDANRRCSAGLRDVAQSVERRSRLARAPGARECVGEGRQDVRTTTH